MLRRIVLIAAMASSVSCASQWKIHGGPKECAQMCQSWGMELVGMVGVGSQEATGPGATACVCEPPGRREAAPRAGASGGAANTAAVIVAIQAAQQQAAQQNNGRR